MLFTVPGLRDEGDDAFVEPDVPMRDDGCEGRFARAYIRDEIPWMDLRHEVRDLMTLAVPELAVYEDIDFEDEYMPDDGMEACWAELVPQEDASAEAIPASAGVQMICSPVVQAMLSMPVVAALLGAPAEVPAMLAQPADLGFVIPEVDLGAVIEDLASEAETICIAEAVAMDTAVMEAMTVMPQPVDDVVIFDDEPAEITESVPAVTFSFGPQEVRGSGWRVCFSF